jgi:hypothetical protein
LDIAEKNGERKRIVPIIETHFHRHSSFSSTKHCYKQCLQWRHIKTYGGAVFQPAMPLTLRHWTWTSPLAGREERHYKGGEKNKG